MPGLDPIRTRAHLLMLCVQPCLCWVWNLQLFAVNSPQDFW